jgi:hypothetical protein
MAINYILKSKALKNLPKLGFIGLKTNHLATLHFRLSRNAANKKRSTKNIKKTCRKKYKNLSKKSKKNFKTKCPFHFISLAAAKQQQQQQQQHGGGGKK